MAAAVIRTATGTKTRITKDKVKAKIKASVPLKALKVSARTTKIRARATDKIIIIKVHAHLSLHKDSVLSKRGDPTLSLRRKRRRRPSSNSPPMTVAGVLPCSPPKIMPAGLTLSHRAPLLSQPAQHNPLTLTVAARLPEVAKAVVAAADSPSLKLQLVQPQDRSP